MKMQEFFEELEAHDWFYGFSDDHRVYTAGHSNENRLKAMAKISEHHQRLFDAFKEYKFSGKPWGTEEKAKPKLEDFI